MQKVTRIILATISCLVLAVPLIAAADDDEVVQQGLLRGIQTRLTQLGYSPGPADGRMGSQSKQAILEYQRLVGLPANGESTYELLETLVQPCTIAMTGLANSRPRGGCAKPKSSPLFTTFGQIEITGKISDEEWEEVRRAMMGEPE